MQISSYKGYHAIEVNPKKKKFLRISLASRHVDTIARMNANREWNPGWSFGFQRYFLNWTHFRRHCWHISLHLNGRNFYLSYGRMHP